MRADKVAIITGASRGIGAATAKLFAENGYAVCINYISNRARPLRDQPLDFISKPNRKI